jgi:DNA-binding beta-propeller fold protein YncE
MELGNLSVAATTESFVPTEAQAVSLEFEQIIGDSSGDGKLLLPQGIDVQEETGNIYVSDSQNDRVAVFNKPDFSR